MIKKISTKIRKLAVANKGATAIEYGLITALISVTLILILTDIGTTLVDNFTIIDDAMKNANQ